PSSYPSSPSYPSNSAYPRPPGGTGVATDGGRAGAAAGEVCKNSSGTICLGLKYVVYENPRGIPVESDREALDNVRNINQLWHDCGIQFQIDRYQEIKPDQEQLRYRTANYGELDEIRSKFMDDETLLVVMTGTWDRRGSLGTSFANAWTNMPG